MPHALGDSCPAWAGGSAQSDQTYMGDGSERSLIKSSPRTPQLDLLVATRIHVWRAGCAVSSRLGPGPDRPANRDPERYCLDRLTDPLRGPAQDPALFPLGPHIRCGLQKSSRHRVDTCSPPLGGTFDPWHTARGEPFWSCTIRAEGPRRLGTEVTGGLAYDSFDLQGRRVSSSRQASGGSASGSSSAVTGAIVRGTVSRSAQGRSG